MFIAAQEMRLKAFEAHQERKDAQSQTPVTSTHSFSSPSLLLLSKPSLQRYQHHLYQPDVYEHIRVVRVDGSLHVNPRQLNESLEFLASWKKLSDVLISETFYHKSKDINIILNASSRIERENAVRNILHPLLIARNADQLRSFIRSGFQIPKTTNISDLPIRCILIT